MKTQKNVFAPPPAKPSNHAFTLSCQVMRAPPGGQVIWGVTEKGGNSTVRHIQAPMWSIQQPMWRECGVVWRGGVMCRIRSKMQLQLRCV